MLYELRIYTALEGRFDALRDRFRDYTLGLFKKHEMCVRDFWIDDEGHPRLYYMLEFRDKEDRTRKWDAFRADPEWSKLICKTQMDGPIVAKIEEILMKRADFFRL